MTRKEELQKELEAIQRKEMAAQMKEAEKVMGSTMAQEKLLDARSQRNIMYGDFLIKFIMAIFVSVAFVHIVYTGNAESMEEGSISGLIASDNANFQLLSVVGPLFGMVLQYYFGSKKKSANGE